MIGKYNYGTGRRKSSVARVFLKTGKGNIVVNDKPVDEYFSRVTARMILRQPLELTNNLSSFDILVNVIGGGESGHSVGHNIQAGFLIDVFFAIGDTTNITQVVFLVVQLQFVIKNIGIFKVDGIEITGFIGGAI